MQIPLPVSLPDDASFDAFYPHAGVAASLSALQSGLAAPPLRAFLHGAPGSGRTHLLQACCLVSEAQAATFAYLPLADLRALPPTELLAGLEACALVCLDDLDAVLGEPAWEEAIFHLHNRLLQREVSLLVAARLPPASLAVRLPDLLSRLQALLVLPLALPDDESLLSALVLRAHRRGMTLDEDVARYILSRAPRGMSELMAVLDLLDARSLAAGRRLSIPFVREALGWQA
jgi:DnaA family protein